MTDTAQKTWLPAGRPTLIGSLPLTDTQQALELIFAHTPEIPIWPQLPGTPGGGMLNQFLEGFPGVVETEERTCFAIDNEEFAQEQLAFYEEYLQVLEDPDGLLSSRFVTSPERAPGIYALQEALAGRSGLVALKAQVTGPFTQLTGIHDQANRLGYYDPTIRDLVVKGLAMKAAWQVRFLKQARPELPILLFIDEPALAGLGSSAFISVSREDIVQDLTEVVGAIHQAGGLAGVHVCANTDWNMLLSSTIDILSFDAYNYFDRFITCRDGVHAFLQRGGLIAWGLVPTGAAEDIRKETAESLISRWEEQAAQLTNPDWDLAALLGRTLITPSCGTGSLTPELAERVLALTRDLADGLRHKHL